MSESVKTLTFLAVAAGLAVVAGGTAFMHSADFASTQRIDKEIGELLFPKFTDYRTVKSLQISEYDEPTAAINRFRVSEINNRWSLPSHENYPADANRQLGDVSAALMDLKKLGVVTDQAAHHAELGLLDPEKVTAGAEGVGKRISLEDASGSRVVDLIIGKSMPDRSNIRFVRLPQQDIVYEVEIDAAKLSTRFEDWIEPDLLKLNPFDLKRVRMMDYSVDIARRAIEQRGMFSVAYNNTPSAGAPQWQLERMAVFQPGQGMVDRALAKNEELDIQKLNGLRDALDDLKIVAVSRKPAGLSSDLRLSDSFLNSDEAVQSLMQMGFYPVSDSQGNIDLASNEGEVRVGMNNGVEYVLRFGRITSRGSDPGAEAADEAAAGEEQPQGANRYIFVAVEFNQDLIEKPELHLLSADDPFKKAAEPQPPAAADTPPAGSQPADPAQPNDPSCSDEPETPPAADTTEQAAPAEQPAGDVDMSPEERKRIEAEDRRKLDEYADRVKEGQQKVEELNDRFADWYYVISDATYQKIHVQGADLIKLKEQVEDPTDVPELPESNDPLEEFDTLKRGLGR